MNDDQPGQGRAPSLDFGHGSGRSLTGKATANHPAALAPTVHDPVQLPAWRVGAILATHERPGAPALCVVREADRFGVYEAGKGLGRIGGQYSFPSRDDCLRIASGRQAAFSPIEERLTPEARAVLSMGLPALDRDKRAKARRVARERFLRTTRMIFGNLSPRPPRKAPA